MSDDSNNAKPNKTKFYVGLSVAIMFLLSLVVAWKMTQNYRKDDSKLRFKLIKQEKEWNKKEYKYDVTKAYTLYSNMCSKCHSASGQGVSGMYPSLAESVIVNSDAETTIKIMLHGLKGPIERLGKKYNGIMNGYKNITPQDLAHVINYIRNSFGKKNEIITPAQVIKTHVATIKRNGPYTDQELFEKPKEK